MSIFSFFNYIMHYIIVYSRVCCQSLSILLYISEEITPVQRVSKRLGPAPGLRTESSDLRYEIIR